MIVAEIGCGESAGPFFEGASEHLAIDIQPEMVLKAMASDPTLTPMVADARQLELPDESVHTILARNVFGDPALDLDSGTRDIATTLGLGVLHDGGMDEFLAIQTSIEAGASVAKTAILREAARVLVIGGNLVAIEQYTPHVAASFFEKATSDDGEVRLPNCFTLRNSVSLGEITPESYAERHSSYRQPKVWAATKHMPDSK